jgi:hypothetical protein
MLNRKKTAANHTSIHLVNEALRQVFGGTVHQAGSYVSAQSFRFDYTIPSAPTQDQLARVFDIANNAVLAALPCVVVFVSCYRRKCGGVWSSVTRLSSARNSEKSGSETLQLLRTAYGDAALSSAQVFRWHKSLKGGMEGVEGEQRARRPAAERNGNNVASVKAVPDRYRRLNVRLIAEVVGLPKTDVHRIRGETADKWFLHYDNAPSHTSFAVREFLTQNKITTLTHPP